MIWRKKYKSRTDQAELSFTLSCTISDVRKWCKMFYLSWGNLANDADNEGELAYPTMFLDYYNFWAKDMPKELRETLSEWAWNLAIKEGLIYPSKFTENKWHFSRKLILLGSGDYERPPRREAETENSEVGAEN